LVVIGRYSFPGGLVLAIHLPIQVPRLVCLSYAILFGCQCWRAVCAPVMVAWNQHCNPKSCLPRCSLGSPLAHWDPLRLLSDDTVMLPSDYHGPACVVGYDVNIVRGWRIARNVVYKYNLTDTLRSSTDRRLRRLRVGPALIGNNADYECTTPPRLAFNCHLYSLTFLKCRQLASGYTAQGPIGDAETLALLLDAGSRYDAKAYLNWMRTAGICFTAMETANTVFSTYRKHGQKYTMAGIFFSVPGVLHCGRNRNVGKQRDIGGEKVVRRTNHRALGAGASPCRLFATDLALLPVDHQTAHGNNQLVCSLSNKLNRYFILRVKTNISFKEE
jgi:hypothetical protein